MRREGRSLMRRRLLGAALGISLIVAATLLGFLGTLSKVAPEPFRRLEMVAGEEAEITPPADSPSKILLVVEGGEGARLEVYTLDGRLVDSVEAPGRLLVPAVPSKIRLLGAEGVSAVVLAYACYKPYAWLALPGFLLLLVGILLVFRLLPMVIAEMAARKINESRESTRSAERFLKVISSALRVKDSGGLGGEP